MAKTKKRWDEDHDGCWRSKISSVAYNVQRGAKPLAMFGAMASKDEVKSFIAQLNRESSGLPGAKKLFCKIDAYTLGPGVTAQQVLIFTDKRTLEIYEEAILLPNGKSRLALIGMLFGYSYDNVLDFCEGALPVIKRGNLF